MPVRSSSNPDKRNKKRPNTKNKAKLVVKLASDKKAENLVILNMSKVANFCEYFVICSGNSDRQVKAIAEGIEYGLKQEGFKVYHREGLNTAAWALLDLGDIIVHIFDKESRDFYNLEHLWQEAPVVK